MTDISGVFLDMSFSDDLLSNEQTALYARSKGSTIPTYTDLTGTCLGIALLESELAESGESSVACCASASCASVMSASVIASRDEYNNNPEVPLSLG